jgi:hypothetical protein
MSMRRVLGLMAVVLALVCAGCGSSATGTPQPVRPYPNPPTPGPGAVPYDSASAPRWFTGRPELKACGSYNLRQGNAPQLPAAMLSCFRQALGRGGAELVFSRPTTEGDPFVTYVRALPGSTGVEIAVDDTRDRFGARRWYAQRCDAFDLRRLVGSDCVDIKRLSG